MARKWWRVSYAIAQNLETALREFRSAIRSKEGNRDFFETLIKSQDGVPGFFRNMFQVRGPGGAYYGRAWADISAAYRKRKIQEGLDPRIGHRTLALFSSLAGAAGTVGPGHEGAGLPFFYVPIRKIKTTEKLTTAKRKDARRYAGMISQGSEPPPLFVTYDSDAKKMTLLSGHRRLAALAMSGRTHAAVTMTNHGAYSNALTISRITNDRAYYGTRVPYAAAFGIKRVLIDTKTMRDLRDYFTDGSGKETFTAAVDLLKKRVLGRMTVGIRRDRFGNIIK